MQTKSTTKSRIRTCVDTNPEETEICWNYNLDGTKYPGVSFLYCNKIKPLMSIKISAFTTNDQLLLTFQDTVIPQEELCIDKMLVPFVF